MLLGRMRKQGYVRVTHDDEGSSRWELTLPGRELAKKLQP
jgi:hypothetical protein